MLGTFIDESHYSLVLGLKGFTFSLLQFNSRL